LPKAKYDQVKTVMANLRASLNKTPRCTLVKRETLNPVVDHFHCSAEQFVERATEKLDLALKVNNMALDIFAEAIASYFMQ
jgi:hypothetical protein